MNSHCEFCWIPNLYSTATNQHSSLLIIVDYRTVLFTTSKNTVNGPWLGRNGAPEKWWFTNGDWESPSSWSRFYSITQLHKQIPGPTIIGSVGIQVGNSNAEVTGHVLAAVGYHGNTSMVDGWGVTPRFCRWPVLHLQGYINQVTTHVNQSQSIPVASYIPTWTSQ